jgi:dTDP-4-dehydrorhamnose 3,5-epimerase
VKVTPTPLSGLLVLEPRIFKDDRGYFVETYQQERYREAGITQPFVQDNTSHSIKDTLRGMHFQQPRAQGKLVSCTRGAIWDAVIDVRQGSPTFGKWFGVELSAATARQLWVPTGFAHGFCVLSDTADVTYKCTDYYAPGTERAVLWNDPDVGIAWPVKSPLLSPKDAVAPRLKDAPVLPAFSAQAA